MSAPFSEPVKRIYDECSADLGDLIHAWTTFERISRSRETVDLFNKVSGHFFGGVLAALRTHAVTLAAKLLERSAVAGKATASLEVLFNQAPLDSSVRDAIMQELTAVRVVAKPVIEYRHRRVVHSDYKTRTENSGEGIPSVREFNEVRSALRNLMRQFEKAAGLPSVPYENSSGSGDVDEIVHVLTAGLASG